MRRPTRGAKRRCDRSGGGSARPAIAGVPRKGVIPFERFVRARAGSMWVLAKRLVGDPDVARRVVEEAFCKARVDAIDPEAELRRLVVRGALQAVAERTRGGEVDVKGLMPRFDPSGSFAESPEAWSAGRLEQLGARVPMRRLVGRLPEPYRDVLLLRDVATLPSQEAAEVLEISLEAVGPTLHRARLALRALIDTHLRDRRTLKTIRSEAQRSLSQPVAAFCIEPGQRNLDPHLKPRRSPS